MITNLLNQSAAPVLEKAAGFHAARHSLLAENIVNASTPGYRQKDLDAGAFRTELRKRMHERDRHPARRLDLQGVGHSPAREGMGRHLVFHDGNDRSIEQLMSEQAKNALQHNLAVELLRKQYGLFHMAIREQVS